MTFEIHRHASYPTAFELYEERDGRRLYLGSVNLTGDVHARLVALLTVAAAVRSLHVPCHGPDAPFKTCDHDVHARPVCRECAKTHPCPSRSMTGA